MWYDGRTLWSYESVGHLTFLQYSTCWIYKQDTLYNVVNKQYYTHCSIVYAE